MHPIHIIVNPAAGQGKAPDFVDAHVVPLLRALHVDFTVHTTKGPRDAGRIGLEISQQRPGSPGSPGSPDSPVRAIIAGGDGTAHELIEGVVQGGAIGVRWELAILPLGTANALHASLFPDPAAPRDLRPEVQAALGPETSASAFASHAHAHALSSLLVLLSGTATPKSLPITLTRILDAAAQPAEPTVASHIVLSAALHAALLADSEALRHAHPGIERFKIAAQNNLPVAFTARATLRAPVTQYCPRARAFVEPFTASSPLGAAGEAAEVDLPGPFSYFLSVTTTARLEPTFVIAPTLDRCPPDGATLDLIVLRPRRDPAVRRTADETAAAAARAARLGEAMGWAYQNGRHVDMTYSTAVPGDTEERGEGEVVCEVFRCSGFDWAPQDPTHGRSHLVCADGSIHTIPPGGKASVSLLRAPPGADQTGFFVYA